MEDKKKEEIKKRKIISIVVSTIAGLSILASIIWPSLKIDMPKVSLLIIAFSPWLSPIFKSLYGSEYKDPEKVMKDIQEDLENNSGGFTPEKIKSIKKEKDKISQIIDDKEKEMKEMLDFRKGIQKYITENTEVGSIADYKEWLDGYKKSGGTPLENKIPIFINFRLVEKEISIPALYGSLAYNFIVKGNGKVILSEGNPGHCGIYYLKNFAYEGIPPRNI